VTSAFRSRASEVGDSYLHIASDARGLGLRMVETNGARNSQMSTACRNRKLRCAGCIPVAFARTKALHL